MENLIYKSILRYKTNESKFVVQFVGTLPVNIRRIENTLNDKSIVLASAVHTQLTNK